MNKRAGEELLSIWWFFILAVIAGGITLGVIIYYSSDVNSNESEANILLNRIINCVSEGGSLKAEIFNDAFDIYKECNLDKKMFVRESDFYFNLSVIKNEVVLKSIVGGDFSFEADCRAVKKAVAEKYPKCAEIRMSFGENIINIFTGSNQKGGKIPVYGY